MTPKFTAGQVRRVAEAALGERSGEVQHLPVGFGNENWRVATASGAAFIVKLGPPGSAAKWAATHDVYRLGREAGLPLPELVHFDPACDVVDGWATRVFTWMDGIPAAAALAGGADVAAFFADVATMARTLHDLPAPAFSSRLDGSAPAFDRWSDYLSYRLPQVLERVRRTKAFPEAEVAALVAEITDLAGGVEEHARPAVCHRDLHLDNLLATPAGRLAAVLDLDGAEAWDPAIDLVKLRWLVFPHHPGSEVAFSEAYGRPPCWDDRVRLCELVELCNAVPNAIAAGDTEFETSARQRLTDVWAT
jgi:Ser/Thr protein kinase RdoA (MazF antagonist)